MAILNLMPHYTLFCFFEYIYFNFCVFDNSQSWNQLPRCQRNLIIVGVMALFVTLLLLLPGDQLMLDRDKLLSDRGLSDAAALPFEGLDDVAKSERRKSHDFKRDIGQGTLDEIANLKKVINKCFIMPLKP